MITCNYFNKRQVRTSSILLERNQDIDKLLTGQINIKTLCNDIVEKTRSKMCSIITYPNNGYGSRDPYRPGSLTKGSENLTDSSIGCKHPELELVSDDHFNIVYSTDSRISFCKEMPILNIPFTQQICVLSNNVAKDPRNKNFDNRTGLNKCPIKKFCGIPIIKDNIVYGQLILANRPKGYSINTIKIIANEINLISSIIISEDDNFIFQDSFRQNDVKFLSTIAHEIHTPIHGIVSMTSLLSEVGELNDKQKEYISCVLSSCEDLIEIVRDSIDFQKIKLGNLGIINDTFDLRKMIAELVNLVKFKADRKGLYIEYTIDKNIPPHVYGDKNRLSQILLNIIGNAIKFTLEGGVKILVKQYPSRVIFTITDTGCGIKKENLDKIFDEYYQENKAGRTNSGMGLGLSLSKKLIQMMGGGITVESSSSNGTNGSKYQGRETSTGRDKDTGTTFTIDIPLAEERYKIEGLLCDEPINILIVDENEKNRIQLRTFLFQWKVGVDVVSTFKEAKKMLEYVDIKYNIFMIGITNIVESFSFTKHVNELLPKAKVISLGTFSGNSNIFDGVIVDTSNKGDVYNTILSVKNTSVSKRLSNSDLTLDDKSRVKVCIVEDDDISSFALKEMLITNGIDKNNIIIIDNGEQAIRNITHTPYDLIFMDCKLRYEMDGIKATKILKQSLTDLRIIGITASVTDDEKMDWLNSGLDGYLTKPFTKNMIESVLQKYF